MATTLIQGGTVVTAVDTYLGDVLIVDDKIAAVFDPKTTPAMKADLTIDAKGKFVMPGGIDAHTHMDMPFGGTNASDDFDTGTLAAAHGGTTTIVDFAIQAKGENLRKGLDTWHAKAEGVAAID
ncbi:MAG: amidohydrolase family protein, partial [Polyangiaceae bacterium]